MFLLMDKPLNCKRDLHMQSCLVGVNKHRNYVRRSAGGYFRSHSIQTDSFHEEELHWQLNINRINKT